ncbi:ciliogenesis and planar polarity effector 2 isoform X3 [Sceloporus undulatus]|uniref:ciliogenesis and planar polarity effector 2 isoform X3 n=1 Tax=Sceloporus undulatus TaxID=8520 RepID=UPI001C4C6DD0|nr:ciliogenesis and planar polarity effector 2 isoform X3 [Sceloporus undulatus]
MAEVPAGSVVEGGWLETAEGRELLGALLRERSRRRGRRSCSRRAFGLLERPLLPPGAAAADVAAYKVFVCGRSGVGKTALVAQAAGMEAAPAPQETIVLPGEGGRRAPLVLLHGPRLLRGPPSPDLSPGGSRRAPSASAQNGGRHQVSFAAQRHPGSRKTKAPRKALCRRSEAAGLLPPSQEALPLEGTRLFSSALMASLFNVMAPGTRDLPGEPPRHPHAWLSPNGGSRCPVCFGR